MADGALSAGLSNSFHALYHVGAIGGLTDSQLLERCMDGSDGAAEAALTVLAERHGPMVLSVCRQVLANSHDAEDAFQATFLVLIRKADSIYKRDSVASWLHGVARSVAQRAKADTARRRTREQQGAELAAESAGKTDPPESWSELHEEISRLPERYRHSVVLCYLEGLSTEAAAERLGCPRGTVLSRLSRAREQLRSRLTRRGVTLPAGLLAGGMTVDTAAVPTTLLEATVRAALGFVERPITSAALASTRAVVLARGILYAMTLSKLKTLGAVTLVSVLGLGGVQAFAYQYGGIGGRGPAPAKTAASDRQAALASTVEKLQAELDASTRRNAELQKELQDIRAELKALKATPQPAVSKKADGLSHGITEGYAKSQTPPRPGAADPAAPPFPGNSKGAIGAIPDEPTYSRSGRYIYVTSPVGDRFSIYDTQTEKARSIKLSGSKEAPLHVVPIASNNSIALMLKGPKIAQIAVFDVEDGTWYAHDLPEPVAGEAQPIVGQFVVAYRLSRSIYAFSSSTKRWSVFDVPEGVQAAPVVSPYTVTIEQGGHIYQFNAQTSEWRHTDIQARIKAALDQEKEEAKAKP